MALTDNKITTYADNIVDLSDTPNADGLSGDQLKAVFDSRGDNEIKDSINGICDDLTATTDGSSGADNIGATAVTGGTATTVQGVMEEINNSAVKLTGAQTVAGVKTFSSSPIVPTPTTDMQAANKAYVDTVITTSPTINTPVINGGVALTATSTELNVLDGITSSTAELNVLDGITSSTAELNILDGVTSSATELNILDGATLSTTELNYVDGVTSSIQTQLNSKYATPTNTNVLLGVNSGGGLGTYNVSAGEQAGRALTASASYNTNVGGVAGLNATDGDYNTNIGAGAGQLITTGYDNTDVGVMAGGKITTGHDNVFVGGSAGNRTGQKVDAVNSIGIGYHAITTADNQVVIGDANVTEFQFGQGLSSVTPAEINVLHGITSSTTELNILDGVTASTAELNVLDGIPATLTSTEIGYLDGVTSSVQTQINEKTSFGVYSGLVVSQQPVANMTVQCSAGTIYMADGTRFAIDAVASIAVTAADATNPRIDIVYVSSLGAVTYLAGTAAATPAAPATPAGGMLVAQISVAANATTVVTASIADRRKGMWTEALMYPTLLNSWVAYGSTFTRPSYYKDALGIVHLSGTVKSGANDTIIFTLPAGYRIGKYSGYPIWADGATAAYLLIGESGEVTIRFTGSTTRVSLDGITFRAA